LEEIMGLSEREQKLLEELERGLMESDSSFAAKAERVGNPAGRMIAGALIAIIGLGVLMTAVFIQFIVIGVVGFLVMLGGLVIATSNLQLPELPVSPRNPGSGPSGSGKNFFEERWDKRQGDQ
jgi:predicted lipid-binding transport protein (Tim44 family)